MKKLFIGLLVVAAGAGIYFLVVKKEPQPVTSVSKKEMIIGKWATGPALQPDSGSTRHQYEFQKDGQLIRSLGDSINADTTKYEWKQENELTWKQEASDSVATNFTVLRLTTDSLEVRGKDSVVILFTKLK
jgi:hypothetical protein